MSKKISQLTSAAKPLSGQELVVMNQLGGTVTALLSDVKVYTSSNVAKLDTSNVFSSGNTFLGITNFSSSIYAGDISCSTVATSLNVNAGQKITALSAIFNNTTTGVISAAVYRGLPSTNWDSTYTTVKSNSANWLTSTSAATLGIHPVLNSTAPPVSYWPLTVLYEGNVYYEPMTSIDGSVGSAFSTDQNITPPPTGGWSYLHHDGTNWVFEYYTDTVLMFSDSTASPTSSIYPPTSISYNTGNVSATSDNSPTAGKRGQICMVDDESTETDLTDAYICVRETPVRWKLIS